VTKGFSLFKIAFPVAKLTSRLIDEASNSTFEIFLDQTRVPAVLTKDFHGLPQYVQAYLREVPQTNSQHLTFIQFSVNYSGTIVIYMYISCYII
jgi:hypothetical protein